MQNLRIVSKELRSYFKPFVDKVRKILEGIVCSFQRIPQLSLPCFILKVFDVKVAVKLRSRRKTWKMGSFGPLRLSAFVAGKILFVTPSQQHESS